MHKFRVDQMQKPKIYKRFWEKIHCTITQTLQNTLARSTLTQSVIFCRGNFSSEQCFYYSSNLKMLLSLSPNNSGRKMFSTPLINQKPIVSNKYQAYHGNLDSFCFSHSQFRFHFLKSTNLKVNFLYHQKASKVETHIFI